METTIKSMEEATQIVSAKLGTINEKANNITSVVTTITKVADQTNLLSLNAAIEAEKANEYGKGFAVLAREIRRLADQTAVATLDIDQTIKEMRSVVTAGVMGMEDFAEKVHNSVEEVRKVGAQLALLNRSSPLRRALNRLQRACRARHKAPIRSAIPWTN